MANDETLSTNGRDDSPSGAMFPVNPAALAGGAWNSPSLFAPPAGAAMPDLTAFLHAFRRHWVLSLFSGLALSAIAGLGAWYFCVDKYTATAAIKVYMQTSAILPSSENLATDRDRFEIYRNSQRQYLLQPSVMTAALRDPKVAELRWVRDREGKDPPGQLARQLTVSFPDRAEVMTVELTLPDKDEAAKLVNAVVNAYMTNVVDADPSSQTKKRERLRDLEDVFTAKVTALRDKRRELSQRAKDLGTTEQEALTLRQKLLLDELGLYRQEKARIQFEARKAEKEWEEQNNLLDHIDELDIADTEVDSLVQSDPVARQLFIELGWRAINQANNSNRVREGHMSSFLDRYEQDRKMLEERYYARRQKLADVVRERKRTLIKAEVDKLAASVKVMKEQERDVQNQVDRKQEEADKFGGSAPDVEMLRAEIKNLDAALAAITAEKEKLSVEISNPRQRIEKMQSEVLPPELPSNTLWRMLAIVAAALAGFCCPAAVVTLWDTRAKRINSCADVSKGLRLPVIGSMPLIPARVIRQLGSPSKRTPGVARAVDGIGGRNRRPRASQGRTGAMPRDHGLQCRRAAKGRPRWPRSWR